MNSRRLAPYILVSMLIHAGVLIGTYRFLNWPVTEEEEAEVLVPVEIVVVREPSDVSERGLADDSQMPDDPGLHTGSRKVTGVESRRLKIEPIDPVPLLGDLRPGLRFDLPLVPAPTVVSREDFAAARSLAVATYGVVSRQQPVAEERISTAPPDAEESTGEPKLTVRSSPELSRMLFVPRAMDIRGGAAIPAYRSAAADISNAEAISPPGSPLPAVKVAADLREAEAIPESNVARGPQRATAAPADTLSAGQTIAGLDPLPKEVSDEPRMMVATLQLNSQPSGAQIFVDDLPSGETPLDMKLPVGKHEFRLVLPDHYDWKAQIELTERNRPYPIFPRLLPIE